jgi:hypothetical protein
MRDIVSIVDFVQGFIVLSDRQRVIVKVNEIVVVDHPPGIVIMCRRIKNQSIFDALSLFFAQLNF